MMYEMFTGQLPFDAETFMGVLTMHMYDPPPLPSQISPEIAERIGALESVVLRALSKKPELRYQSMAEVRDDVLAVYRGDRRSVALDKTLIAGNATADTLAPPPPPSEPPFEPQQDFDSAAASLLDHSAGELVVPAVPPSASRLRWAVLAATVVIVVGVIALSTGDADSARHDKTKPAAAVAEPKPLVAPVPQDVPTEHETAKPTVVRTIEIGSEPSGAEVFHDGALLGATPLSLPRPTDGALDLQIKLTGFEPLLMRVTSTSPARIVASLNAVTPEKRPVSSKVRPSRPPRSATTPTKVPGASGMRDMVDPWNE
jgi:eukaryotic-like serine/threonine-protein kinase